MIFEALSLLHGLLLMVSYVSGGSQSFAAPLTKAEEDEAIAAMSAGDEAARDKLVEHNMRLVAHIAKKYLGNGRDMDDLISIGGIGLIKAVHTYDANKGRGLGVYAARCIENEILMSVRAERKSCGEVPIHESIGMDKDGNSIMLMDILGTSPHLVDDQVLHNLAVKKLYDALSSALSPRERCIIELRYGLTTGREKTQREIASLLGISRSYVSRLEKKAIAALNAAME